MDILFNDICTGTALGSNLAALAQDASLIRQKYFSQLCLHQLDEIFPASNLFLTHSATGALEAIAILLDVQAGDEIIMPSFTFVSTANAFVSKGATPVFADIDQNSFNINLDYVERLITPRTKAIVAVHYAGHPCDLNRLQRICHENKIFLIEDAAMAFGNTYRGQPLGSIGDFGVISFDSTKQISAIQGGLLLINRSDFYERANNVIHLGTNKQEFIKGSVPYYEWVDYGSKFQMSEINAAVLAAQLSHYRNILEQRNHLSQQYYRLLRPLEEAGKLMLPPPEYMSANYHQFHIVLKNKAERKALAEYLRQAGVEALFHYIPLHSSKMGRRFCGYSLPVTDHASGGVLRLPFHNKINTDDTKRIAEFIFSFFRRQ
jgi:dTDP-4-amino-4,6-dideoxygalactose transaminase